MSNPDAQSTATIKFGGQDAPWFVAYGNPITQREQLLEFAGLKAEDFEDKPLVDVVIAAAIEAQAHWGTRKELGGTAIKSSPGKGRSAGRGASAKSTAAKADETETEATTETATEEPDADPNAFIFEKIADAQSLEGLKKVFVLNKAAFNADKALQAAYTERKNALT